MKEKKKGEEEEEKKTKKQKNRFKTHKDSLFFNLKQEWLLAFWKQEPNT